MKSLIAIIVKELKLLLRDPAGLIMLFVLPAIFIFVLSLALQGTFLSSKKKEKLDILVVNNDRGETGKRLIEGLSGSGYFNIITDLKGKKVELPEAKKELHKGNYKVIVSIPEDATEAVDFKKESKIEILIDPVLSSDFAANITSSIQAFVYVSIINNITKITANIFEEIKHERLDLLNKELAQTRIKKEQLAEELAEFKKQALNDDIKFLVEEISNKNLSELDSKMTLLRKELSKSNKKDFSGGSEYENMVKKNKGLLVTQYAYTETNQGEYFPNSVQQNVPGWTIFALFWIVQVLSLNILIERQSGAFKRILISPVSSFGFFMSKTIPYFFINIIQAVFMFSIGVFVLPLFGSPALELRNYPSLILITSAISLTAITLGLLFSSISKSMSVTASLAGAVLIIMTIFGGIMIPKFIMPNFMQKIGLITPHAWALDAYQKILVKNYSLVNILPDFFVLMAFSALFLTIALFNFNSYIKKD